MVKKILSKTISAMLLTTMTFYTLPVLAFTKDETVYADLDSQGNPYKTIVSTHLKNSENESIINDISDLLNIENTNGDEKFNQDGNNLVWDANGADIYYQGESQKELPISCNVKYELNGKEISASDLAGKSGKVKITLEYTNKDEHIVNINGRKEKMYTPFVVIAGTIIDNSSNSNIEITNGKVVNDGSKTIALGIAMPGLKESLNISDIDIPSNIEITMETTSFEFKNIVTYVTPKIIEESDLEIFDKIDEIYGKVNTIKEASEKIEDGASNLKDGVYALREGVNTAYNGSMQISSEVKKATESLATDKSEALDDKTLSLIGNRASITAKKNIRSQKETIGNTAAETAVQSIESQKETIGSTAAKTAAQTIEKQKATIGNTAAKTATQSIEKQKETIGNTAAETAAKTIEKQKVTIGNTAAQTAKQEINSQKEAIGNAAAQTAKQSIQSKKAEIGAAAAANVPTFELTPEQLTAIKNSVKASIESNTTLTAEQKALVIPIAQSAAQTAAMSVASMAGDSASQVTNATAQTVAEQVAMDVAKTTAQTVAEQVAMDVASTTAQTVASSTASQVASTTAQSVAKSTASQVASTTAQSVASSTASQVASTTAQTVASSTASQVASATAQSVAEQTANSVAEQVATSTARTIANEVKGASQERVISQMSTLSNGLNQLTDGLSEINTGTNTLYEGASALSEGITTFNKEAINVLYNYINGNLHNLQTRVEKLQELSNEYNNFTMLNDGTEGSVKFILIIDSVKKQENDTDKQEIILNENETKKKEEK